MELIYRVSYQTTISFKQMFNNLVINRYQMDFLIIGVKL